VEAQFDISLENEAMELLKQPRCRPANLDKPALSERQYDLGFIGVNPEIETDK
jgi:hypothetical protein